jgi:hypothetical protein
MARLLMIPPTGRLLNCELCGEYAIREVDGRDCYTEIKGPFSSEFYEALGRFVVAFAFAENGADHAVHTIFRNCDGKKILRWMPKNLTKKLEFLRAATDRLEALQFRAPDILDALSAFESLVERRHHYVHGIYGTPFGPKEVFQKIQLERDQFQMTEIPATIKSILEDRAAALAVGTFFMSLSLQLIKRLDLIE